MYENNKKALIIIDYVYDFIDDNGRLTCGKSGQILEDNIIKLVEDFSKNDDFIIVATDNHDEHDEYNKEKNMFPLHCFDENGRTLYNGVNDAVNKVNKNNYVKINKCRYSAFASTDLDLRLKERSVLEIHLVGVCTDICILHTAIDAYNLGYKIVIHEKAVGSFNKEGHQYSLTHFKNVLAAEVI